MNMTKFIVTGPLRHGGKRLEIGDDVTLTEKAAAPLLLSGTIGRPSDPHTVALLAEVKEKADAEEAARKLQEEQRAELAAADERRKQEEATAEADRLRQQADEVERNGQPSNPGSSEGIGRPPGSPGSVGSLTPAGTSTDPVA